MSSSRAISASAILSVVAVLPVLRQLWTVLLEPAPHPAGEAAPPFQAIVLIIGMFCALYSGWGIVNAAGLWMRRSWARQSMLLFAGMVIVVNFIGLIGPVVTGAQVGSRSLYLLPRLILLAIGAWWVVLFRSDEMIAEFKPEASAAGPSR